MENKTDIEWIKKTLAEIQQTLLRIDDKYEKSSHAQKEYDRLDKAIGEKADSEDVKRLQDNQSWIVRLVVGAIVSAVIVLVLK